jgi:hypothetical protein
VACFVPGHTLHLTHVTLANVTFFLLHNFFFFFLHMCKNNMCTPSPWTGNMYQVMIISIIKFCPSDRFMRCRVLLLASHFSLLTAVAEGTCALLAPLPYVHVYAPVLPFTLVDFLDAPTPYLMGLHSSVRSTAPNFPRLKTCHYNCYWFYY